MALFSGLGQGNKMQKIYWIGEPGFADDLQTCGWETVFVHPEHAPKSLAWPEIRDLCQFEPDIIVYEGRQQLPLQKIEKLPCLTVFHSSVANPPEWHINFASRFDCCLVQASDSLSGFSGQLPAERILWLPPHSLSDYSPPFESMKEPPVYLPTSQLQAAEDVFLKQILEAYPQISTTTPDPDGIPQGRLAILHAEPGQFNQTILEAMGNGCCVLMPRVGNGLERLFVDGEHFVGYAARDPGDFAYRLDFLLTHPEIMKHIASAAQNEVNLKHRPRHRAETFTDFMCEILLNDPAQIIETRLKRNG